MDAMVPLYHWKNEQSSSHVAAEEYLVRIIMWIGLVIVGIFVIPAAVLFVLIFAVRSLVDWAVSKINRE